MSAGLGISFLMATIPIPKGLSWERIGERAEKEESILVGAAWEGFEPKKNYLSYVAAP